MTSITNEEKIKKGVLIINTGSPLSPKTRDIRKYLAEFLSDKRVMTMPSLLRWLLLHLFILLFRPSKIKEKYESIWDGQGFPLLMHGKKMAAGVSEKLGGTYEVEIAMRYGTPSQAEALNRLKKTGVNRLLIFPLFPQYASATTGSVIEKVMGIVKDWQIIPELITINSFFDYPAFINAWVEQGREFMDRNPDWILFSFHGLPESHILNGDAGGETCLKSDNCCAKITDKNAGCYRAQCFETAKLIARGLGLTKDRYSISFQSRLGRARWLEPSTFNEVRKLAESGKKKLLVFCPSFVADCLETTEEILVEIKNEFSHHGGEELLLVPSLNSGETWIECVTSLVKERMGI